MNRKVSLWQSVVAVLAVLLAIAIFYAIQWFKPDLVMVKGESRAPRTTKRMPGRQNKAPAGMPGAAKQKAAAQASQTPAAAAAKQKAASQQGSPTTAKK